MNDYKKTDDEVIFDCGCSFRRTGKTIVFNPDLHDPNHTINFSCDATYKILQDGLTEGVFQLGSPDGKFQCKKLVPTEMEHISALGAIVRPGCKNSKDSDGINITTRYQRKKNGKMTLTNFHPVVDKILEKTYGENIYQETSLELAKQCAGFTLGEADILRKGIGKKIPEIISQCKKQFMEKGKELGILTDEQLEEVFGWIEASQRYSFNHCVIKHTTCYRMHKGKYSTSNGYTVEHMYKIRNDLQYAKRHGHESLYKKWKRNQHYGNGISLCSDGRIRPNIIKDILYSGKQPYFRINLANGDYIECTIGHKFPTPFGEKKLSELKIGDKLFYKGEYEKTDFASLQRYSDYTNEDRKQKSLEGKGTGKFGQNKKGEMNHWYTNGSYTEFQKNNLIIPRICQRCSAGEDKRLELHHINGDRSNSSLDNLIRLCASCHKKAEYAAGRTKIGEKGYPYELVEITSIIYQGIDDVYDVEMEGPNHNFIANGGIVTSNSHSWSYGLNSYVTAYLKAHFPVNFYKSWFQNEDKREAYINFVNEAKIFNINIYPPDLRDFRHEFYIKKKHIYFGLNNIKGLVTKDLDSLAKVFSEKNWSFGQLGTGISWLEFLATGLESVSSTTAEGLINSGSLDCFGLARARMSYEYERWNRLTAGEKKQLTPEYTSLTEFVSYLYVEKKKWFEEKLSLYEEKSAKRANSERVYKTELKEPGKGRTEKLAEIVQELTQPLYNVNEDTIDGLIFAEENLLGVSLTCHKTDEIANAAETASCMDILKGQKGYAVLRVKVEENRPYKCKNGATMAFLQVSDKTGRMSAVIFGKKNDTDKDGYEEYCHLLTRGSIVFISGELSKDSFIIKRAYPTS